MVHSFSDKCVQFSYVLGALLLVELTLCILAFVFSSDVQRRVVKILQKEALVHYRDDDDLRNLIDWTQHTVRYVTRRHRSTQLDYNQRRFHPTRGGSSLPFPRGSRAEILNSALRRNFVHRLAEYMPTCQVSSTSAHLAALGF